MVQYTSQLKYVLRLEESVSRATGQNPSPLGNNNLNFRLARNQVMHLETAANLCACPRQENNVFAVKYIICSIFELGGITKHLMTDPTGNSELSFLLATLRISGKQNSLFPFGSVIKCFLGYHNFLFVLGLLWLTSAFSASSYPWQNTFVLRGTVPKNSVCVVYSN